MRPTRLLLSHPSTHAHDARGTDRAPRPQRYPSSAETARTLFLQRNSQMRAELTRDGDVLHLGEAHPRVRCGRPRSDPKRRMSRSHRQGIRLSAGTGVARHACRSTSVPADRRHGPEPVRDVVEEAKGEQVPSRGCAERERSSLSRLDTMSTSGTGPGTSRAGRAGPTSTPSSTCNAWRAIGWSRPPSGPSARPPARYPGWTLPGSSPRLHSSTFRRRSSPTARRPNQRPTG